MLADMETSTASASPKSAPVTYVSEMEQLPGSERFTFPEWNLSGKFRATAWAYLCRQDGGITVVSETTGQRYAKRSAVRIPDQALSNPIAHVLNQEMECAADTVRSFWRKLKAEDVENCAQMGERELAQMAERFSLISDHVRKLVQKRVMLRTVTDAVRAEREDSAGARFFFC
jgi:hypothetical protein